MARIMNRMLIAVLAGLPALAVAQDWAGFEPMDTGQLEAASGRQGIPIQWLLNNNEQSAMVSDNVLSGQVLTGDNRISDQAFQNMSGVATVIQNTGNQVVIQDSTQINILFNQ